jgi:RNA polymerase sigma-70 factor (sigma-E family)
VRQRDEASFEQFAQRVMPRLLRTAWLLTGDPTRAEDAVQESLVRLFGIWSRVRHDEPEAYCHRILRNLVVSTWHKERRLVLVPEIRDQPGADQARTDDRSADRVAGADPGDRVDLIRALQQLSAREREIVVLRHYADLSERTVAELLGVSLGTVKSSASRGLDRLRELIVDKGEAHVQ